MGIRRSSGSISCPAVVRLRRTWRYGLRSWPQPCVRSLVLAILWTLGGKQWPAWIIGWPWLLWVWQVMAVFWPELGRQPLWRAGCQVLWQGQRVAMVVALGFAFRQVKQTGGSAHGPSTPVLFGLGCQYCGREEPWVEVRHDDDGSYQATLCGHFTIRVPGDHPFRVRMLMLFLRLLDAPGPSRRNPSRFPAIAEKTS